MVNADTNIGSLLDDDYHLPALTVRETLRYAAMIKLPSTISRKTKIARAEEVLNMLGLRECANVLVGGELLKGISGGEKRRLSLACQMVWLVVITVSMLLAYLCPYSIIRSMTLQY